MSFPQDLEFALSFICSLLFHSKSLRLKNNHEQFAQVALVALTKRVTESKSLLLLFKKEQHEWFTCDQIGLKNELFARKNVFNSFPPLLCRRVNHSHRSFLRARGVILGCCLLHKSTCEWIAPITHYKRATMSDFLLSLFKKEQLRDSLKKRANCNCALLLKKKSNLL